MTDLRRHYPDAPWFFSETIACAGETQAIAPDEARHANRVLRLTPGDPVILFDGAGTLGHATLRDANGACLVREVWRMPTPRPQIEVYVAPPKGARIDDMVDQLSQVAADVLTPLKTARSVVDPRRSKLDRLRRRAREVAKQCKRAHVLAVTDVTAFEVALGGSLSAPAGLALLLAPGDARPTRLAERVCGSDTVRLLIGPEGGWTSAEQAAAEAAGALPWSIGPHVMRIETAAIAATALIAAMRSGVVVP